MSLSLAQDPPPESGIRTGNDVDLLASALHHALQNHTDDKHPNIEIIVNSDVLTLRGTSVDVTPALLSGHVVLHLAESTTLKQITLQFRGKAKLPPLVGESIGFSNPPTTYLVCNHEWSFLEGEKKHSHTLKAGHHLFPFQLRLGGSLPSTLYTGAYGGASIAYKLRAVATRPGFAHNLQTQKNITLLRALSTEAFEYQRLLEIENTWPEKVMYSIMVPHKAWAAGDHLTAVVKLSPLTKAVRVLSVVTTLNETAKVYARTGFQERTKHIVTTRHEFHQGQAVCVEPQDDCLRSHQFGTRSRSSSLPSPDTSTSAYSTDTSSANAMRQLPTNSNSGASGEPSTSHNHLGGSSAPPQQVQSEESHSVPVDFELSPEDIATKIEILIPVSATPTHSLDPIVVSHRIRWIILMRNPDGHTSELRCSLPLHILDYRLIDEARSATAATRRLLLGGPEVPEENDPDMELPSYPSHIRDRIANMYLPAQSAFRVTNPWLYHGISPVQPDLDQDGRHSGTPSGTHTPLEALYVSPPPGNDHADLEYVNSELTLSLSQNVPSPIEIHRGEMMMSSPETTPSSRSATGSRRGSRAPSPEQRDRGESSRSHSRRSSGPGLCTADLAPSTYLHSNSAASRNLHSLVHVTMKPLTSLSASFALPTRHHAQAHLPPASPRSAHQPQHQHHQPQQLQQQQSHQQQQQQQYHLNSTAATIGVQQQQATVPRTVPVTSHTLLHRAFTEVPDYGIASRGFLGGVTPLETLQGLPSYEEAEIQRSHSESDLVSMMRRHGRHASTADTSMPPLRPELSMTASTTTTTTTTNSS